MEVEEIVDSPGRNPAVLQSMRVRKQYSIDKEDRSKSESATIYLFTVLSYHDIRASNDKKIN